MTYDISLLGGDNGNRLHRYKTGHVIRRQYVLLSGIVCSVFVNLLLSGIVCSVFVNPLCSNIVFSAFVNILLPGTVCSTFDRTLPPGLIQLRLSAVYFRA
ncbi:hypothetical protein DPMN_157960 [Dreissena polymorpha]|uniref:Uncharacterized protein n=1 Tax=Dreissena polymorpha TaxID=45954 RepID=A0A9D4ELF2_DREPO|nr:hypothetical protein DPMN_157960 [Dreissena polymorpha]